MTPEDYAFIEYLAAERDARESEYLRSLATECVACGATIHDSPHYDDFGAICEQCAKKEERPKPMDVKEALIEAANLARGRAKYFEARAGRGSTRHVPAATNEIERARFERDALAFSQAADVIEEVAQGGHWP